MDGKRKERHPNREVHISKTTNTSFTIPIMESTSAPKLRGKVLFFAELKFVVIILKEVWKLSI